MATTRYTIEKQGPRWVASDGVTHVEGEDPDEAFDELMLALASTPGQREAREADEAFDRIDSRLTWSLATMIRISAMKCPAFVAREHGKQIADLIEEWATAREELGDRK